MSAIIGSLAPVKKERVHALLQGIRVDVSDWANFKGGPSKAAANPKYCYNWSFEQPDKFIVLCIWHTEIVEFGATVAQPNNLRSTIGQRNAREAALWRRRAELADRHVMKAYLERMPVRAIILDGRRRDRLDPESKASSVKARRMDDKPWAVTEYDFDTGDYFLVRDVAPVIPFNEQTDPEAAGYPEGALRLAFRRHRHRERRARNDKIRDFMNRNGGRLFCEVPRCGFDFKERYGKIGEGYAQVHHTEPLGTSPSTGTITRLSDLRVVCPNCHAMIHIGGENRRLEDLIKIADVRSR